MGREEISKELEREIARRKRAEKELQARIRYEGAIAACSKILLTGAFDDGSLVTAFETVRKAADVSRIYLFENFQHKTRGLCARQRIEVCGAGIPSELDNPELQDFAYEEAGFERWMNELPAGREIHGNISKFPRREREFLEAQKILSILVIPVFVNKRWLGFIGFDDMAQARKWWPEDVTLLGALAEMTGAFVKRSETGRELLDQERKLGTLVNNMPVMIEAFDEDGNIVFWNRECEMVTGYSADEILRNPEAMSLLYPDAEYRRDISNDIRESGDGYRHRERRLRCKDGSYKIIAWSDVSRHYPLSGWRSWNVGVDQSEREHIERKVIQAKKEWESTFDSVPNLIAVLSPDMTVRRLNMAFADRLHQRPQDIVGKPFKDYVDADGDSGNVSSRIISMADSAHCSVSELSIPGLGGHFLITVCPYYLGDERKGSIFIAHDISKWKTMERQLRQVQKMEALGTLAGGIAHDFNNILGVIMGYTEINLERKGDESGLERRLGEVLKAGNRAKDLIGQILTFSRQGDQEVRPLNLDPMIKETLKLIRAMIPANIETRYEQRCETDVVLADPTQIHQVLMNLCTNAVHAMKDKGGIMDVSTLDFVLGKGGAPGLPGLAPGRYVRLSVRDTGEGIDPRIVERIFDPFFTTKKPGEGTGMGLSVVHGIVEKIGGGVAAASEPGQGTTMHVYIPQSEQSPGQDKMPVHGTGSGQGRVLLVDDEDALVEIGREMLEDMGYSVSTYTNSLEALEAFSRSPKVFDLVITDQTMPGMSGVQLAGRIAEISSQIPVILCTGFKETISPKLGDVPNIRKVLGKPVMKSDLAAAVDMVLPR